jgi:hypothetical protein
MLMIIILLSTTIMFLFTTFIATNNKLFFFVLDNERDTYKLSLSPLKRYVGGGAPLQLLFLSLKLFSSRKREVVHHIFTMQKNLFCQKFTKNFILSKEEVTIKQKSI